jgi:hypothetical protein
MLPMTQILLAFSCFIFERIRFGSNPPFLKCPSAAANYADLIAFGVEGRLQKYQFHD